MKLQNNYAMLCVPEDESEDVEIEQNVDLKFAILEGFSAESGFSKVFYNLVAGYLLKLAEKSKESRVRIFHPSSKS